MYLIHIHKAPSYLKDIVTPIASVCSRGGLRSASNARYEQPRMRLKFGQRCFSYAAPVTWNTLPPLLQQLTNSLTVWDILQELVYEGRHESFATLKYLQNVIRDKWHDVNSLTLTHLNCG